jgi:branched-chain amino acid transport system ATP-binding protein
MAAPLLQVTDLHAGYGKAEVLRGLNISAPAGSVITVIGPNGAGKSTMLGALMGLLPARGRLLFDGHDISRLTLEERVMRGLALVPEKRELFGTMTVEDNLVLGGWRPLKSDRRLARRPGACLHAVPAPEGTPRAAGRHAQRAASARCWPSAAR